MKKISALLLAALLAFPMVGCGGSSDPIAPANPTSSPMSGVDTSTIKGKKATKEATEDKVGEPDGLEALN
ncbi:MAG: hypothetical protein AAF483_21665 [Planctomycetota bacterium]